MVLEIEQNFGTSGSPSSAVRATSATTTTLTDSYAPFAIVMNIPSITGKTLGTDNNDYLSLNFWTSAGSNFNARTNSLGLQDIAVDFWGIHVKVGTHTTDAVSLYKQPELGPELVQCQRYFWRSTNANLTGAWGAFYTTTAARVWTKFSTQMRAAPTVTYSTLTFDKIGIGTITATSITNAFVDTQGVSFDGVGLPSTTVGAPLGYLGIISADAEL